MKRQRLPHPRDGLAARDPVRLPVAAGFSITELLVVIAIIGLINGLSIAFSSGSWQRERVNAVAVGLAGWLEEVRSNALRQTSADPASGGCVISLPPPPATTPPSNAAAGTILASVSPASCASSSTFAIPGVSNGTDRYAIATTNASTITFTPRGSVTSSSDAVVNIHLQGSRQLRCVRVSSILGLIRIGNNSEATSSAASCSDYTRF